MSAKKINRALLQDILSKGEGVSSISSEAVDWCIAVACEAAKSLAASGRRTPGGRLMAPRTDAGLMVRHLTKDPESIAGVAIEAKDPGNHEESWSDYNDWQQAVRKGETKLPYEDWKAGRLQCMTEVEQADKAERKGLTDPAEKA